MKTVWKILGWGVGLVILLVLALAGYIYATAIRPANPVGYQSVMVADPGHNPISVSIWYPTSAKPGFILLGSVGERVASDGPVVGSRLPLIVISHGTGGGEMSLADTALALAEQGFVVAAPTHPGDNYRDSQDVGKPQWLPNRSRHIRRVIDMALDRWKDRSHLDPKRVGVFGFSAGATTALIAIGGVPDLRLIASHCADRPEFVCKLTTPAAFKDSGPVAWQADGRIAAAVLAAPGLGFTFERDGLRNVRVPVQLWAGAADQTVPYATNAGTIQRGLARKPEVHVVPGATHYSFLMPCGLIGPPQLCRDTKGFDRKAFHDGFNRSVVSYFQAHLPKS